MKRFIWIVIAAITFPLYSQAQCVIYACDNTGAFGAGFNNDNAPTTYQECTDYAIKKCKEAGGTSCTFMYKSAKPGWFAFITGFKPDGRRYMQGGDGYSSKTEAEAAVRSKYRADGGVDNSSIKVYSWYAYSNVKY